MFIKACVAGYAASSSCCPAAVLVGVELFVAVALVAVVLVFVIVILAVVVPAIVPEKKFAYQFH